MHRAFRHAIEGYQRERQVSMTSWREEVLAAEHEVLKAVAGSPGPTTPKQVINTLAKHGFREETTKRAIWYLVDEKRLRFSKSRTLSPGEMNSSR